MTKAMKKERLKRRILTIDVGGNNVKTRLSGRREMRQFQSGPKLTPRQLVKRVHELNGDLRFDVVSIGYPGIVVHGKIIAEPYNLGRGWVGFDFRKAFGRPTYIMNDAAMQALGSYEGGRMLFLGLGTGLGSALIVDGVLESMELAHLPYRKGRTFEDYVGLAGLKRLGKKKWRHYVADVVKRLRMAVQADYVVLGGGNARLLKTLPAKARLGDNSNAFLGGSRLWKKRRISSYRRSGSHGKRSS